MQQLCSNRDVTIRSISWQETIAIRHMVLWPNKKPEFCHVDGDNEAQHFGAFVEGKLVCVASVYVSAGSARLRKFATLTDYQGRGIGTKILSHIISKLKSEKVDEFWCDARESALGFYRRFGLTSYGERFYKGDVAYFKMRIQLTD